MWTIKKNCSRKWKLFNTGSAFLLSSLWLSTLAALLLVFYHFSSYYVTITMWGNNWLCNLIPFVSASKCISRHKYSALIASFTAPLWFRRIPRLIIISLCVAAHRYYHWCGKPHTKCLSIVLLNTGKDNLIICSLFHRC